MINVQEGVWLEKDWIEFEESDLREELDRYGPFIPTRKLSEILEGAWKAYSTPLFHYSAGVLAARTVFNFKEKTMMNDMNKEIARSWVAAFCNEENVESVLADLEKVAHSVIKPHRQKLGLTDEAMSAFSFERIESAVSRANAAKLQEEGKKLILPIDIPLVETALKLGLE